MSRLFPTPLCTFQKILNKSLNIKQKKSFLTPFRWCYDRQTNSFIPLSFLDFCNPQCNSFLKFVRIVKKSLKWCLSLLFNFNDMILIGVKVFQGAFLEFGSLCDDWPTCSEALHNTKIAWAPCFIPTMAVSICSSLDKTANSRTVL